MNEARQELKTNIKTLAVGVCVALLFVGCLIERTIPETDYAARDRGQLKNIYLALLQYAEYHEGVMPPDLATVAQDYPANLFKSPKNHKRDAQWNPATFDPDYAYLGAGVRVPGNWSSDRAQKTPLMYTQISDEWSNVLFLDGRIVRFTRDEADKLGQK